MDMQIVFAAIRNGSPGFVSRDDVIGIVSPVCASVEPEFSSHFLGSTW